MSIESLFKFKEYILNYLHSTYNSKHSGWGFESGRLTSVTNTCEALLCFDDIELLNDHFLRKEKIKICNFLQNELEKCLSSDEFRIRDLAYATLSLEMLGVSDLKEDAVKKIISSSLEDGGWPINSKDYKAQLIPTYNAMLTLQKLGEFVDDRHYDWLSLLHKGNGCSFQRDDGEINLGASSIVLFLTKNGKDNKEYWLKSLEYYVQERLTSVFSEMLINNEIWSVYDKYSSFTIYGFGHALYALNLSENNLFNLKIDNFLSFISTKLNSDYRNLNIASLREFCLALRAIRLNFDPFQYFSQTKNEIKIDLEKDLEFQKKILLNNVEKQNIRQTIIDEMEKDLIKQRKDIPDLVINKLNISIKILSKKILFGLFFITIYLLIFSLSTFSIIEKIKTNEFRFIDIWIIILAIIPVIDIIIRIKNRKNNKKNKEPEN